MPTTIRLPGALLPVALALCLVARASAATAPPLAGLPSPPGAHLAQIAALGDNAWLRLPIPADDPVWGRARGRSWGGRALMPAPDLGGAFFFGEGPHAYVKPDGHIMDDLWFYDLNANRWIAVHPGTDVATFTARMQSGDLLANDYGQLVDRTGQPIPVHTTIHAWDLLAYDTDLRRFAWLAWDGMYRYYLGGLDRMEEGVALFEAQRATKTQHAHSPWFFDVASGRFDRYPIDSGYEAGGYPFFQYLPSRKQYFLGGDTGVAFFDPRTRAWTQAADHGPRPPGYDHGGCYDSKRERIYMGSGNWDPTGGFYAYDLATQTWTKPASTGPIPGAFRTNDASAFYDAVNDVVTIFQYVSRTISVYDPVADAWTSLPIPEEVVTSVPYPSFNAYYDTALNAYVCHVASDGADNGVMWIYRYRGAGGPPPPPPTGHAVPGRIEAEDFDAGGEGVAYHDADAGNTGGGYRATDVDIRACVDVGGGWQVGWISAGEWLRYTIDVPSAGTYGLALRVASGAAGASFRIAIDGVDVGSPVTFGGTGGWDAWSTTATTAIALGAGRHAMRLTAVDGSADLNALEWSSGGTGGGTAGGSTAGGTTGGSTTGGSTGGGTTGGSTAGGTTAGSTTGGGSGGRRSGCGAGGVAAATAAAFALTARRRWKMADAKRVDPSRR